MLPMVYSLQLSILDKNGVFEIINDKEYFKEDVSFMRRKRMMITGIISIALGISLVGCGGGKENKIPESRRRNR